MGATGSATTHARAVLVASTGAVERLVRLAARAVGAPGATLTIGTSVVAAYGAAALPASPGNSLAAPVRAGTDEVGTLVVVDQRPRAWTTDEHAAVADAADLVGALIGARPGFHAAIVDSVEAPVAACDLSGELVVVNRALRDMLPPEELPLARVLDGGEVRDEPLTLRAPGRRTRYFRMNGSRLHGLDGDLLGAAVAVHEVTNLVRAGRFKDCEIAVARVLERDAPLADASRNALRAVVTTVQWPYAELWLADESNQGLRLTASYRETGRDIPTLGPDRLALGQGLVGTAWQRGVPVWLSDLRDHPELVSPATAERCGLRAAVAVPVRSGDQTPGVLAFFADTVEDPHGVLEALLSGVAAHLGQFLERRRVSQLAAELARSQNEYVGLVGHELRTPLTSISAYTDLALEDPDLSEDLTSMLAVIQRNAATLRGIIAALLDLAALDAGHAQIRPQPANLADVVREALDAVQPEVLRGGVRLVSDVAPTVMVAVDTTRIRQVVDNLLANAVKYSLSGATVDVRLRRDGDSALLVVDDTGIGIPEGERAKVFNRFFRGSGAKSNGIPGSGLGLAISQVIVDRHGGTVALVDRDGPGSRFELRLPLAGSADG